MKGLKHQMIQSKSINYLTSLSNIIHHMLRHGIIMHCAILKLLNISIVMQINLIFQSTYFQLSKDLLKVFHQVLEIINEEDTSYKILYDYCHQYSNMVCKRILLKNSEKIISKQTLLLGLMSFHKFWQEFKYKTKQFKVY